MALKVLCGVPGSGKTLNATRLAIQHYKKENSFIKRLIIKLGVLLHVKRAKIEEIYRSRFYHSFVNNVYSSYPILLDKKKKYLF